MKEADMFTKQKMDRVGQLRSIEDRMQATVSAIHKNIEKLQSFQDYRKFLRALSKQMELSPK